MQQSFILERLQSEPQVLRPDDFVNCGAILAEFLRWPRGEVAATGDSYSPIFLNRVYALSGADYREQPTLSLRSRFALIHGHGCHGVALAAKEDLTKVRITLDSSNGVGEVLGSVGTSEVGVFQIRDDTTVGGGSFHPPNTWITRPLNFNSSPFGRLDALGRLELDPGHYCMEGWATGMEGGRMRCRFRSVDNSINWPGATTYSLHYSWHIPIHAIFTVTETQTFVLEMRCDRDHSKPWGFGYASKLPPEIYASLMFSRKTI